MKKFFSIILLFILAGLALILPPKAKATDNEREIRINLETRWLVLIEGDKAEGKYRIAGTGDPFESPTPKGTYSILEKERRHKSTLSGLWMPYSIRFWQGYYIHEIPENDEGVKTRSEYSLGCVRLPAKVAPKVYEWIKIGDELTIYKNKFVKTPESEQVYKIRKSGIKTKIKEPKEEPTTIPAAELEAYKKPKLPINIETPIWSQNLGFVHKIRKFFQNIF